MSFAVIRRGLTNGDVIRQGSADLGDGGGAGAPVEREILRGESVMGEV
jgi:hypothetical protein